MGGGFRYFVGAVAFGFAAVAYNLVRLPRLLGGDA